MPSSSSSKDWLDSILEVLPEDTVQVNILKTLSDSAEKKQTVKVSDLAAEGFERKSGVEALSKMRRHGLINIDGDGRIELTRYGKNALPNR